MNNELDEIHPNVHRISPTWAVLMHCCVSLHKYHEDLQRSLAAALILASSLLFSPAVAPSGAHAAPAEAKGNRPGAQQPAQSGGDYLGQLLNEINARRAAVGSPPLAYANQNANAAVGHYLADLT